MNQNGVRLDLLLLECVGQVVRSNARAAAVWDAGGRDVAAAKLRELGVSAKPLTLLDVARGVGFLGPDPDVIDVKVNRGRRAVPRV